MESQEPEILKMRDDLSTSTNQCQAIDDSIFGDGDCGEPLMPQHLVIDFTPVEEDSEFIQKKCCAFWDFIYSQPELQRMMAQPETVCGRNSETSDAISELELPKIDEPVAHQRTAVSMLEIVEGNGLIDRIFEAKLPQSLCSLGSREYPDNDLPPASSQVSDTVCTCSGSCKTCFRGKSSGGGSMAGPSAPHVVDLCKKMDRWDDNHPKSMNPPGHPPPLSHCIMQRNRIL